MSLSGVVSPINYLIKNILSISIMEWIVEKLQCIIDGVGWLRDNPNVTFSGVGWPIGATIAGMIVFIIKKIFSFWGGKEKAPSANSAPQPDTITSAQQGAGRRDNNSEALGRWADAKVYGLLIMATGIAILFFLPRYAIYINKIHWISSIGQ
ncbi:hypothetical protein KKHLCK_00025 [Candidatus Electrothrix laxa]